MTLNLETIWGIVTGVSFVASAVVSLIPAPATGPLAVLHKVVQVLALAVGNAKIASNGATPTVGEIVEATVDTVKPVANTTS